MPGRTALKREPTRNGCVTIDNEKDDLTVLFGIGIDIVKISRFERMWKRNGDRLASTILLNDEYQVFINVSTPANYLAEQFAAKEAIVKAMGTGFCDGAWVNDVGTIPNSSGQPQIIFSERARLKCERLGIDGGHISVTRCDELVCAVAVLVCSSAKSGGSDGP